MRPISYHQLSIASGADTHMQTHKLHTHTHTQTLLTSNFKKLGENANLWHTRAWIKNAIYITVAAFFKPGVCQPAAGASLFFIIAQSVCIHVYVSMPEAINITTGMIWCIWTPCDWLNKLYSFYILVVNIVSMRGLSIDAHHRNLPNKSKLALYQPRVHSNSHLKQLYIWSASGIKGMLYVSVVHVLKHLKEELAWATHKQLWVVNNLKQLYHYGTYE